MNYNNTQYISRLAIPFSIIYPHAALQPTLSKGCRPLRSKRAQTDALYFSVIDTAAFNSWVEVVSFYFSGALYLE
jgi:hypothetical protein